LTGRPGRAGPCLDPGPRSVFRSPAFDMALPVHLDLSQLVPLAT